MQQMHDSVIVGGGPAGASCAPVAGQVGPVPAIGRGQRPAGRAGQRQPVRRRLDRGAAGRHRPAGGRQYRYQRPGGGRAAAPGDPRHRRSALQGRHRGRAGRPDDGPRPRRGPAPWSSRPACAPRACRTIRRAHPGPACSSDRVRPSWRRTTPACPWRCWAGATTRSRITSTVRNRGASRGAPLCPQRARPAAMGDARRPRRACTSGPYKVDPVARSVDGRRYDLILVFYGWEPQAGFADSLRLARDERGYIRTDFATAETSVPVHLRRGRGGQSHASLRGDLHGRRRGGGQGHPASLGTGRRLTGKGRPRR